jgi:hypothetical protein
MGRKPLYNNYEEFLYETRRQFLAVPQVVENNKDLVGLSEQELLDSCYGLLWIRANSYIYYNFPRTDKKKFYDDMFEWAIRRNIHIKKYNVNRAKLNFFKKLIKEQSQKVQSKPVKERHIFSEPVIEEPKKELTIGEEIQVKVNSFLQELETKYGLRVNKIQFNSEQETHDILFEVKQ